MSDINLDQIIDKDKKYDIKELFEKYKYILISIIYYSLGLFIGSYFYKYNNSDILENIISYEKNSFSSCFFYNLSVYFSIYFIVLFLGFCLFGNHIINLIPAAVGAEAGIKITNYFTTYSFKGLGYALIMIIPFTALFISVLSLEAELSTSLSKKLMDCVKNENRIFAAKSFFKKYFLTGLGIIAAAFIKAIAVTLLSGVVTI